MNWGPVTEFEVRADDTSDIRDGMGAAYGQHGRGSILDNDKMFLFSTVSRPTLGPTQPSVQWALSALKRQGRKSDHRHLVPRPRMVELCLCSPIHLQDVVLNLTDMCKETWIHYQCSNIIFRFTFITERTNLPKTKTYGKIWGFLSGNYVAHTPESCDIE
jgi:hypothetical protein